MVNFFGSFRVLLIAYLSVALVSCTSTSSQNKTTHAQKSSSTQSSQVVSKKDDLTDASFLPTTKRGVVYYKSYYVHSYSSTDYQSEWVAYLLSIKEVEGDVKRSNEFVADPTIPGSPLKSDYNQTGYDRGHLAPAADMKINDEAMAECFYMTNMSPQEPAFNRGIWKDLEEQVRNWAEHKGSIYVVTGALFEQNKKMKGGKIIVPSHFYKILLDVGSDDYKMVAFLLPNAEGVNPLASYAVKVDDIEARSGIDFYPQLPDTLEEQLESSIHLVDWMQEGIGETSYKATFKADEMVYVCSTSKGKKYHKKGCGGLKSCKGVEIAYPIEKARQKGYSPCGTCY